jgi:hypothetical protein
MRMYVYVSIHPSIDLSIHRNGGLQSLNAVRSTRAYACGARGTEATFWHVASLRVLHVPSLPPSAFNLASFVLHPVCVLDVACGVLRAARFARRMVYVARSA